MKKKSKPYFKFYRQKDGFGGVYIQVSKNKGIELNYYCRPSLYSTITFYIRRKQDHAGFNFEALLFGIGIEIDGQDNRHWCYNTNKFKEYPNE